RGPGHTRRTLAQRDVLARVSIPPALPTTPPNAPGEQACAPLNSTIQSRTNYRSLRARGIAMKWNRPAWTLLLPLMPIFMAPATQAQNLQAGEARSPQTARSPVSCAQFMAPKKEVSGKPVGQEECLMLDYGLVDVQKKY